MLSVFEEPESLAAVMSGVSGAPGARVSIVMLKALDTAETLPAKSVAIAVMLWVPSPRALVMTVALPLLATALPTRLLLSKMVTMRPEVAETVNVGVLMLVMLSELETPVSLAVVRLGVPGAEGTAVSIVMLKADEAAETLPARSVALAVML
jgi:hypothetical protein